MNGGKKKVVSVCHSSGGGKKTKEREGKKGYLSGLRRGTNFIVTFTTGKEERFLCRAFSQP